MLCFISEMHFYFIRTMVHMTVMTQWRAQNMALFCPVYTTIRQYFESELVVQNTLLLHVCGSGLLLFFFSLLIAAACDVP